MNTTLSGHVDHLLLDMRWHRQQRIPQLQPPDILSAYFTLHKLPDKN